MFSYFFSLCDLEKLREYAKAIIMINDFMCFELSGLVISFQFYSLSVSHVFPIINAMYFFLIIFML